MIIFSVFAPFGFANWHGAIPLGGEPLHGFGHIVDLDSIALGEDVDDRLRGERAVDVPIGIGGGDVGLNGVEGRLAGLAVARAKADHKDGLLPGVALARLNRNRLRNGDGAAVNGRLNVLDIARADGGVLAQALDEAFNLNTRPVM